MVLLCREHGVLLKGCVIVAGATVIGLLYWWQKKEGITMKTTIILFLLSVPVWAALAYVVFLIIKALGKYIRSEPLRQEKAEQAKTLGETLKRRRTACKMTQEFVAEALGVSRQAVSKWESGQSDPSTTNLLALAKLFGVRPEELLQEAE